MAGQNPGKSTLKISAIKDGTAENCNVYGVLGKVEIPTDPNVEVAIHALEGGNARASGGEAAAVKGELINRKGDEVHAMSSPGEGQSEKNFEHFGCGKTVALLIAGAGKDDEEERIFMEDVQDMERLLTGSSVGVRAAHVNRVFQGARTKQEIKETINKIVKKMKGTEDWRLIVYYTGHFGENTFWVERTGDEQDYLDNDFVDDLWMIPAKYVLFITDMCESSSARLRTKQKPDAVWKPEPPRVFDLYQSKTMMRKKGDKGFKAVKVVQWASSEDSESSHYSPNGPSWFTRAIKDVITDPKSTGGAKLRRDHPDLMYASILRLNKYVCCQVDYLVKKEGTKGNPLQNPTVKPANPKEDYFDTFPRFAHIR